MEQHIAVMKMKPVCAGRFLIDIPENANISYRGATVFGYDITSWIETDEEFSARVTQQEAQLTSEKNEKNGVSLEYSQEVKNEHLRGRIFVFNRMWLPSFDHGIEQVEQSVSIRALVRSHNVTYSFYSKFQDDSDVPKLIELINQLRWRGADEIPAQAGFCFEHALLVEPLAADISEFTAIFVGLKEHPDLSIAFSTFSSAAEFESLLQRAAKNSTKKEFRSRIHTLREGSRTLAGVPGEELLEQVDEFNGAKLHSFMWESLNRKDDPNRPLLVFELDTGHGKQGRRVNSSLSDIEAQALWDKMSSSLRRHHPL